MLEDINNSNCTCDMWQPAILQFPHRHFSSRDDKTLLDSVAYFPSPEYLTIYRCLFAFKRCLFTTEARPGY